MSSVTLIRRPGLSRIRARRAPLYVVSLVFVGVVVVMALLAPWIAPYDPNTAELGNALAPSSADHLLGVDAAGRDTLSRLVVGARTSLLGPLGVVVISTLLGAAVGVAAGWRGGRLDSLLSRGSELTLAFPGLLMAILIVAVYGEGLMAPVVALSIAYFPYVSRLTRSLVLAERARPYVAAYQVQGHSGPQICVKHVVPNIAPVVLAQSTVNFGYALIDLAGLSFLGLGVPALTPDWGRMVFDGKSAIQSGYPLSAIVPCLAIILTVVAFNVVGERWADKVAGRKR
ncbi:ABC transporter permease [Embleya scabrispora]|uniref:ABC transporter permease n=1 Tax=Embleya scabrispora TaxID=159449 RepID=A0A1T3NI57_9ACTN|nr:ABC transporter permease [Embleya scabrispora]OPC76566.1 ABC transporter permease [Embleya scabrispora]